MLEDEEDKVLEHRIQMLHEAELYKLFHVGVVAMGEDLGERKRRGNVGEIWGTEEGAVGAVGAVGTRKTRKRESEDENNEDNADTCRINAGHNGEMNTRIQAVATNTSGNNVSATNECGSNRDEGMFKEECYGTVQCTRVTGAL